MVKNNKKKTIEFSNEEKIEAFDRIYECFYEKNFGQASKSEIDLLMFNIYFKKISEGNDDEKYYSNCSDYKVSKDLGITQQRVRNLKIKNQLVYGDDYEWKDRLSKLIKNARYDKTTKKITVNIPDPNLFIEIENYLDTCGGYIEKQLNSKILQMRVEYFLELVISLEDTDKKKEITKELKKQFKSTGKDDELFDEKNIAQSLINGAVDITTIVANVSSIFSPGNRVAKALVKFLHDIFV